MSHIEEQQASLTALVDAILVTGTPVPTVIHMFAAILRLNGFVHEADQIDAVANGSKTP